MKDAATYNTYAAICRRAQTLGLLDEGEIPLTVFMDIESADTHFNMRLAEWLEADNFNFAHDFCGIRQNINRNKFPATDFGFFLPRFAGLEEE